MCRPGDVAGDRLNSYLLGVEALREHGGVPALRRWFQEVLGELLEVARLPRDRIRLFPLLLGLLPFETQPLPLTPPSGL